MLFALKHNSQKWIQSFIIVYHLFFTGKGYYSKWRACERRFNLCCLSQGPKSRVWRTNKGTLFYWSAYIFATLSCIIAVFINQFLFLYFISS